MSLTLQSSGITVDNTEVLAPIQLSIAQHEVVAIQADPDYMGTFFSLIEEQRNYATNEWMLHNQPFPCAEQMFIYRADMGEYKRLTPKQMLQFWADLFQAEVDIDRVLALTELTHLQTKKNKQLTYSEKKRLQIARSLIQKTNVYVFEDPTRMLDLQSKRVFNRVIQELLKQETYFIMLTSSLEEAIRLGTKAYRLDERGLTEVEMDHDQAEDEENDDQLTPPEETVFQKKFEKISAKADDKFILFDPLEIDYVETRDRQTLLHVKGEEFHSTLTMKDIEEKLLPYGFYRCHRSYLVNLQRVREVVVWSKNSYSLTLDKNNQKTVPLSKSRYGELKDLLHL